MAPASQVRIRGARPSEADTLGALEARAAKRFEAEGLGWVAALPSAPLWEAIERDHVWVAEQAPAAGRSSAPTVVGFVHIAMQGKDLHLVELDVDPRFGQRGIGTRLVRHVERWAFGRASRIVLTTFRDVPFNGPWYGRLGYRVCDVEHESTWVRAVRRREREAGLDRAPRVVMAKPVLRP